MSLNKKVTKSAPLSSKDLPKILSFFSQRPQSAVDRASFSYIIRPSEKKTLAAIIEDVASAMHLSTEPNDLSVYDLNGCKIRTFRKLYEHSASTFVLKSEANVESNGDIFEQAGIGPRLLQSRGRSSSNRNWVYGNSELILQQPKSLKPATKKKSKSRSLGESLSRNKLINVLLSGKKKVEESDVVDTEAELATLNLNEAEKCSPNWPNWPPKGDAVNDDLAENGNTKEEQTTATTTSTNEGSTRAISQIEARLAQVRALQDRMMEGESYLDKIGRDSKQHPRYNPFVIFGGGDIDWQASKEAPATVKSHRPNSAIPKFTVPVAVPTEEPTKTEDDTSSALFRPQTVLLGRPNPNLSDVPEID